MPRYVDAPHQFLWWESDEIIPVLLCYGVGLAIDSLFIMLVVGLCLSWMFGRYKVKMLDGVLAHMFFWAGFTELNNRFKNGLSRRLIP